ncbi:MAG: AbrB/MazE/SpoVT family DNA-binding domain-containing protein, partial [Anaerolineaceae bacterium]
MRTTITKRAQTVVPAALRERYGIKGGDYLEWIDDGQVIK